MRPFLPQHRCRVCGLLVQTFGQNQLCANHLFDWLLATNHGTLDSLDPETFPVMIDEWLERRVG